ncbi:hypothetical protein [Shewanella psychrotolerans]|uniref:hypothetical protein n=1 Tax=Shewanella psychrotolerans TaxID=2864206 RepID=UPI001C655DFA|nr:hypothetical protein [Shewanella psychrotolerans]QYK02038.1 hypothetical protein K0I62_03415 [Shewanella psychrotolerans]
MLDAICRIDDLPQVTYSVFRFQALDEAEMERLRQHLYCPVCDGKAYFRKASSDGKAACFGSRYHQLDCREFKPSLSRQREELDAVEVNQLIVDSEALIIDFTKVPRSHFPVNKQVKTSQVDVKALDTSSPKKRIKSDINESKPCYHVAEKPLEPNPKIGSEGLEKLLHSLLRGSDLASSDLWVYTDEKYRWRAKNLFVNFSEAEPTENGAPRMYWGTISHSDKAMSWLNPADCKDVGIPIDGFNAELKKRFAVSARRDLEGAGIIIFGKCFWNKDKTRKIIQLWNRDISRMHISIAEEE